MMKMSDPTLVEEAQQPEEEARRKPIVLKVLQEEGCCGPNCGPDTCSCP
ncbi:MAG: hypothetical protein V3U90_08770 [Dehalococcoidia bacterium]